jgi:Family of unknown function (DUF5681)
VGYGKPPRHTRFKKGQSGNLKGRPKGSQNLTTLLSEALNERVIVTENGGRRRITMRQAINQAARQTLGHRRLARDEDPARHRSGSGAASGQHLLDHSQPEREAEIQPDGVADDLAREPITGIAS